MAAWLKFCSFAGAHSSSPSLYHLQLYLAHLSASLKSFQSLANYLATARKYIRRSGGNDPSVNSAVWPDIMKGYKRILGDAHSSKLPIGPTLLVKIKYIIDTDIGTPIPFRLAAWAAILTGFHYFFRKSNLTITRFTSEPYMILKRQDISSEGNYIWISTLWSKTNNFRDRTLEQATQSLPGHPLCLKEALRKTFESNSTQPFEHAFTYKAGPRRSAMHDTTLQSYLKSCLEKLGLDKNNYTLHSLRSGGASFAFDSGLPQEIIQHRGDWKSQAYLRYLEFSSSAKINVASRLAAAITSLDRPLAGRRASLD